VEHMALRVHVDRGSGQLWKRLASVVA